MCPEYTSDAIRPHFYEPIALKSHTQLRAWKKQHSSFSVYFLLMTRRTFAWTAASLQLVKGANEKLRVAAIGTGGRGQLLMRTANSIGGIEWVAIADVNEVRATEVKAKLAPSATIYSDYRKLLDDKSIDAVIIASPDHWHVPMLVAALEAGKDVYIEKPLTHTIEEGAVAIEAVKRSGRIVQVGYQQRSFPHIREARQRIQAGEIGQVTLVQAYWYQNYQSNAAPIPLVPSAIDWKNWLGGQTARDFSETRYRRWRWFWDYGGGTLTDLFSHWADTIHWIMDDDTPISAQASGGVNFFKDWECPDTLSASYRYPKSQVTYDSTLVQSFEDGGMVYRGSKGTVKLDRGGYSLFTEEDVRTQKTVRPTPAIIVRAERDGVIDHMENFLECVRSRKQPNSDVVSAVASANAAHYGNLAYKTGQTIYPSRQPSAWRPLFNGRDLSNWVVDTKSCWRAVNGSIVGKHAGLKYNDFLRTREHFEDFELKAKFRLKGGEGNSGIQFRSEPVQGTHEVSGYQADVGQKYWGCLYDESRRKRILAEPPDGALAGLDKTGWNEYVIRAQGNFITLHLNGVRTVHYIEQEPALLRRGFIALQVHSGPSIEVEFKNLMLREL